MGIRYYAYAVDSHDIEAALVAPRAFISSDPLADAWGLEPHAWLSAATFVQAVPKRDMLYLDKAWRELQHLTRPDRPGGSASPAYRMLEGHVTTAPDGYSWIPWTRALRPDEMAPIARDLDRLTPDVVQVGLGKDGADERDLAYVLQYVDAARSFVAGLVQDRRGMAYLIG
jgi:hypothetical protein